MAFWTLIKTLLIPLFIALIVYLALNYAILPFIRSHRHRYNNYIPLNRLSDQTSSLWQRATDRLAARLSRSSWAQSGLILDRSGRDLDDDESLFDDEEGEGMVGFDVDANRRRFGGQRADDEDQPRLSRDLEEGFRDDSDEESHDERLTQSRRQSSASLPESERR
ncbi:MAG: hypothetical protein M1814_004825 [Vezdaea aestivalis]|nr:MAG: hypothetical protein M1814_004825 [Vezdaea aestivalis]